MTRQEMKSKKNMEKKGKTCNVDSNVLLLDD